MAAAPLTILHFNDAYNIEGSDREPVGGAARIAGLIKTYHDKKPLVLFSGDCFNPSIMSTVTKGKQMVPILNAMGVRASVVGNHDLDFGIDNFVKLSKQCTFSWLLANVLDKTTGRLLGEAVATEMVTWEGWKVGLMGLAEQDWFETLGCIDDSTLEYTDFVEMGRKLALELKAQGADVVIALTHMREHNDRKLLAEVAEIDIVLGGHDHHYVTEFITPHDNLMVKSGTDFKDLTVVEVERKEGGEGVNADWTRVPVTREAPEDPEILKIVEEYMSLMGSKMEKMVGKTAVDLDGRFSTVRSQESNLGNFVTDVWKKVAGCEVVLLNSGTLRSDTIHEKGALLCKDLVSILPMIDETVVLACPGRILIEALENGVSQYPSLEGRFPQVSGIKFSFDPSQPPGKRVLRESISINGEPLELEREYTLATKSYMASGRDGYDCLAECKVLVDDGVLLPTAIRNHFYGLRVLTKIKIANTEKKTAHHWRRLVRQSQEGKQSPERDEAPGAELPPGICVWDPSTGDYVINSVLEGRIVNVAEGNSS